MTLSSSPGESKVQTYFHGGKRGLDIGDMLVPSPPHVADGCPLCVARASGRTMTVGEFRGWLQKMSGRDAARALAALDGADDAEPLDPPSAVDAVYITTDRDYALWYAARSQGDMYMVAPVGKLTPSQEDAFPTWTVPRARIVAVMTRKVRLRERERRRIMRRWKEFDDALETAPSSSVPSTGGEL